MHVVKIFVYAVSKLSSVAGYGVQAGLTSGQQLKGINMINIAWLSILLSTHFLCHLTPLIK